MTSRRAWLALLMVLLAVTTTSARTSATPSAPRFSVLSSVKHVFVLVLENKDYDATFGANSPAPYLARTLTSQGQLLTQYYGIGHVSLDNYIAMISGQAPNADTQSDCQVFTDFAPTTPVIDPNGQAVGQGCVFPTSVKTLADQLSGAGLTWHGYMEDMKTPCRHPDIGTQDKTQSAKVGDQYAGRHNPFIYFHSIIDTPSCAANVVDLSQLQNDLADTATTSNLTFITPNLCHDGHDAPCVDGEPGGLVSANAFLQQWVPLILASPAYKQDGMLVVSFDEAEVGQPSNATACCGETAGPNSASPGINGPGGGRIGAVVLSPFTVPGSTNDTPYNHYSLLRSIEDVFGLQHLGFAAASNLTPFGPDVLGNPGAASAPQATTPPPEATTQPSDAAADRGAASIEGVSRQRLPATGRSVPLPFATAAALMALGARLVSRRLRPTRA